MVLVVQPTSMISLMIKVLLACIYECVLEDMRTLSCLKCDHRSIPVLHHHLKKDKTKDQYDVQYAVP